MKKWFALLAVVLGLGVGFYLTQPKAGCAGKCCDKECGKFFEQIPYAK